MGMQQSTQPTNGFATDTVSDLNIDDQIPYCEAAMIAFSDM